MTTTLADITSVLNLIFADEMADAIRRDVLLPNLLRVESDRNASCTWTAKFKGRNTSKYSSGADVIPADFSENLRRSASLPWARIESYASVDGLAAAVAAANGPGRQGLTIDTDLLMEEVMDAIDEMALKLSEDCYVGDPNAGVPELSGADTMIVGTTYAGIDSATLGAAADEWTAPSNTLAIGALTIDALRQNLHRPFKDTSGFYPEFVTCDGTLFDAVGALFEENRRYTDEIRTQAAGVVDLTLVGGFRAIVVDSIPYIEDRHATANTFYAWHSSSASFRQLPSMQSAMMPPDRVARTLKLLTGTPVERDEMAERMRMGERRIQPVIHPLAKNGDSSQLLVKSYLQLRHKYRNRHAQLVITP